MNKIVKKAIIAARPFYLKFIKGVVYNREYRLEFNINEGNGSDRYVFNEIFGKEDAYRRDQIIPLIDNGTVLEIGAHKGFFTLLAATHANSVIAFEPDIENFEYLVSNIKLNKMKNIVPVNKAVFITEGNNKFTISNKTAARHTFFNSTFSGKGKEVQVECTTIESIFKTYRLERVDLLKMDCEGSEYDIIYNADKSLFKQIDAIAMEIHEIEALNHKKDELLKYMEELGYTADVYDERWLESLHVWMAFFTRK